MNKAQRELYGVTDQDWSDARHRVRSAMVGGRARYFSRSRDFNNHNGKQGTITKVIKSSREIELAFDSGEKFRAFAHNVAFC
jgi:hypothetical protein